MADANTNYLNYVSMIYALFILSPHEIRLGIKKKRIARLWEMDIFKLVVNKYYVFSSL